MIFIGILIGAVIGVFFMGLMAASSHKSRCEECHMKSEFVKALAEELESEGVTYEDLVRIDEEVKAEVEEELKGASK